MDWISAFIKETLESQQQQKEVHYEPESRPSPDADSASALSYTSQPPEQWAVSFCCLTNQLLVVYHSSLVRLS